MSQELRYRLSVIAPPVVAIALFFLVWELGCWALRVDEFVLPRPSVALAAYLKWQHAIWPNALQTLMTTIVGLAIAIALGVVLGALIGYSALMYRALYPVLIAFNSIPKAALVPVFVIWFGVGTLPAILIAFLISFFPIAVNVATGIATVEPELRDVLRSLGASQFDIFRKVGFPRAAPYFFASLKVAATLAFVGSVIAELGAANSGIGNLMVIASARFEVSLVFAGLMVVAAMGIALYAVFAALERRLVAWAYRSR
ncbi:MAG: ABC transporter permease [Thermoflexales bacterium]|nr:ABC transporter permease [Thermoflexales bacterium]MCS7324842.1 ABC transporter permease [Thermoflexales bacterium]MCX7937967.1 ABC transporter permease [Thermoflexales bacterium]MDW8054936.1 ABC transporter permease [Anaerolineae bacterium]MDW8293495.1 ABC transporter permease [Anaerolineae bacterium]